MIGLLVFSIFAVWLLVTVFLFRLIVRKLSDNDNKEKKSMIAIFIFSLVWLSASAWYFGGAKFYYDAKISKICEQDGGVRIYRKIYLPSDNFDASGDIKFYDPTDRKHPLGEKFIYSKDVSFLLDTGQDDWITAKKYTYKIFLRESRDLLAEEVVYRRSGGDYFTLGFTSSFSCPESNSKDLFRDLFFSK